MWSAVIVAIVFGVLNYKKQAIYNFLGFETAANATRPDAPFAVASGVLAARQIGTSAILVAFLALAAQVAAQPPPPARLLSIPIMASATPASLLKTPPVETSSASRGWRRTDTQDEASARSPRSSTHITRTTSPSDNRSTTLSHSISSGGGSYYSSDLGHSPCSLSSSDYLTPPQFQLDTDKKPYRARRQSSNSLNMVRKPKRARTDPQHRSRRRYRRGHKCLHGTGRPLERDADHWCLPGCQVAPTAPKGMKELCYGHVGRYRPVTSMRGNADTYGRILPRLRSDPAPPVVTRRWSSVEIGSHQIHLASTLPVQSVSLSAGKHTRDDDLFIPRRLSRPYRSSTFTLGAIDHDIVRTVREKLTLRKVPSTHLQIPATITLRRASGTGASTAMELLTPGSGLDMGGTTPRPDPISQADREADTAYLITKKEIDSIAELIEANLRRKFRPHNRISAHSPATSTSPIKSPTFTLNGMVPETPSSANSAVTITPARASRLQIQENLDYLQLTSMSQARPRGLSRTMSQKSTHEVIWEARDSSMRGSPNGMSSPDNRERQRSSTSNSSSQLEIIDDMTPRQPKIKQLDSPQRLDKTRAFDPNNARESITDWSWRLPPTEIPLIVTSDSESNDFSVQSEVRLKAKSNLSMRSVASAPDGRKGPAKGKARTCTRPAISSPDIEDVVSFPPLRPRKSTNDWYSPLPDLGSSAPPSPGSQSLYGEGIDATGAVPVIGPKPMTHAFLPLTETPRSPSPAIDFDPDYNLRRKSLVKAHPHTPACVGSQSTMGSSIGVGSGERRKSSVRPGLQRVQTIDNIQKGKRAGTWTRNRPPSVCPPPKTPSPAEMEEDINNSLPTILSLKKISELVEGRSFPSLQPQRGPPMPKPDRVGIYGKVTGTVRAALGLDAEGCQEECPPRHVCDDCAMDPRNPSVDWIG